MKRHRSNAGQESGTITGIEEVTAERVRLGGDVLNVMAFAVAGNEETQQKFRTALLWRGPDALPALEAKDSGVEGWGAREPPGDAVGAEGNGQSTLQKIRILWRQGLGQYGGVMKINSNNGGPAARLWCVELVPKRKRLTEADADKVVPVCQRDAERPRQGSGVDGDPSRPGRSGVLKRRPN